MSASWSLGGGPPLPLLCFVEIQWLHVHRIEIYRHGYIHGYPPQKSVDMNYEYEYGCEISYPRQAQVSQLRVKVRDSFTIKTANS